MKKDSLLTHKEYVEMSDQLVEMVNKARLELSKDKEEIIKMALECVPEAFREKTLDRGVRQVFILARREREHLELDKFAELVAAHEREACAKVCEDSFEHAADTLAQAIRARGQA